jgi:epoxyqueuosine reductase
MPTSISKTLDALKTRAAEEGLQGLRITGAQLPQTAGERLELFLEQQHHGEMAWLEERKQQRKSPDALWPEAKSAIMVALPYTCSKAN